MKQRGFTVIETIVGLFVSSVLLLLMMKTYTNSLKFAHDEEIKIASIVRAQAVLEAIGAELRVLGNGVPYDQSNFQIGENTLTDISVTYPIIISSATATTLPFRLNETGDVYLLTSNYDPSAGAVITLTSTEGLEADDTIYLSNSVVGGDDGLYGEIQSVNHGTNQVTLKTGYEYSPGAIFDMGTICERVPVITYVSAPDGSEITRDAGLGPVRMATNSTFQVDYLTYDGNVITLPITELNLINELRRIRLTVSVNSKTKLSDGTIYTAVVSQTYSLRNLNYLF